MLSHTLTVLSLPVGAQDSPSLPSLPPKLTFSSKEALQVVSTFIRTFFSCEYCRDHFSAMADTLSEGAVLYDGDAVLWLWEAHNTVNKRLKDDVSSDPSHPKVPFPSRRVCPYCYSLLLASTKPGHLADPGWEQVGFGNPRESFFSNGSWNVDLVFTWNRTAVLLYLWDVYHWNHSLSVSRQQVIQAAWPRQLRSWDRHQPSLQGAVQGVGFTPYDVGLCVAYYVVCVGMLAVALGWLLRRRLGQRSWFLHP